MLVFTTFSKGGKQDSDKLEDAFGYSDTYVKEEKELTKQEIRLAKLDVELIKAGFPIKAKEFQRIKLLSVAGTFLVIFLLTKNVILAAILGGLMMVLPGVYVKFAQERKKRVFENQIPIALSLIRNSVEAGFSFMQAMEVVATEMQPPISEEFGRVLHETSVGKDLEEALNNMINRVESEELKLVVVAVLIQREVGGNLGEIIDVILETIKDRIQIKGEIRTLTSQGRLSAMVICALPVVLGILMYFINPEYMTPLFVTTGGQIMLGIAFTMILLGAYLISKIIKIDF